MAPRRRRRPRVEGYPTDERGKTLTNYQFDLIDDLMVEYLQDEERPKLKRYIIRGVAIAICEVIPGANPKAVEKECVRRIKRKGLI